MLIPEFLEEMLRRSGMEIKDLATATGWSTGQYSRIKNSNTPGTWKAVMWVITATNLRLEDCLTLPFNPDTATDDDKARETFELALKLGDKYRSAAIAACKGLQSMIDTDRTAKLDRMKKGKTRKAGKIPAAS